MTPEEIVKVLRNLGKEKVKFIVLFGSHAAGKSTPLSDKDIAVYYDGTENQRFRFRMFASGHLPENIDLQIFQDLPVYVRSAVLHGKMLYHDDFQFVFNQYIKTIREFGYYKKHYDRYITELGDEMGVT
jgi:uncharacterized protein